MESAFSIYAPSPRGVTLTVRAALVLLAAMSLPLGGCIVAAAGAAGYAGYEYANGEYIGVANATVDKTYHATIAALDQMKATVTGKTRSVTNAELRARDEGGTSFEITLSRQSVDFTRITIRVGVFGDEARSKQIIAKIKENL